ncbi:MAG: EF-P lysine aminoacylase EpmA [Chromatiales bacterium]|jgi:lysyl-tRNA synthetase class 2
MSDWQPCTTPEILRDRAEALATIRQFFAERQVLEVDTPVLASAANPDMAIESLALNVQGSRHGEPYFLQTSPEFFMKRLLCAGSGSIYQLCHVFRDDELGRYHNPEFTMLEWYRTDFDMFSLIEEVETLMGVLMPALGTPATRISYHALFEQATGLDLRTASPGEIRKLAADLDIVVSPKHPDDGLIEMIFSIATASWMREQPAVVVYHFPACQASLAKLSPDDPAVALRFEYYVDGVELANGFEELDDPIEQRRRFDLENARRRERGARAMPVDEHLLAALEQGMPACSGVAAGIDRILMIRNRQPDIASVMAFPFARA